MDPIKLMNFEKDYTIFILNELYKKELLTHSEYLESLDIANKEFANVTKENYIK